MFTRTAIASAARGYGLHHAARNHVRMAPMGRKWSLMEGEPGGSGGGTPPPADPLAGLTPEQKAAVEGWASQKITQEVTGLKNKNTELLGSVTQLKESLKKFDGFDPEAVNTILKKFTDDEEAALIKGGKIEEVLSKRTDRLKSDFQKKLDAEAQRAQSLETRVQKLAQRATSEAILKAASKSGALPEATEDIILRAQGAGWTINEDGEVVATKGNEIVFGKDGKTPLTPQEWIEELRASAPHLWPRAQGQNAPGGAPGKAGSPPANLSPEARITWARQNASGARH